MTINWYNPSTLKTKSKVQISSKSHIRSIVLVANPEKKIAGQESVRLRSWLKNKGIRVLGPSQFDQADGVITLGGDGTILSIASQAARARVPVFGVNVGRLGFMTTTSLSGMRKGIEQWLAGKWLLSPRLLLEVTSPSLKGTHLALNDVVVRIGAPTRVTHVHTSINGQELGVLTGDGVIVSTSTGSTAYSLSAQGPVVHPEIDALILTPICPHSFSQRPIVFPSTQTLTLCLQDKHVKNEVQLCFDGQRVFHLKSGDEVHVKQSTYKLQLVYNPQTPYFHVLREKLSWGGRS